MFRFGSQFCFAALAALAIGLLWPPRKPAAGRDRPGSPFTHNDDRVLTGVDVYERYPAEPFKGSRVGLITNQTGVDSAGQRTIDVLASRKDVKLVALFSPEHGIKGQADSLVADSRDERTGLPIYSLYGKTRRPTDEMLRGIDVLVFDLQDAGVRFYTYVTTLGYALEAAAAHHIRFFVFDRPDPLGGEVIEGPMLDTARTSFTGYFPLPVRYGMTLGELAQMFNSEDKIGADLHVESMLGWRRRQTWEQTGLKWVPPSPNLQTVAATLLYPGTEILQAGGISVGRGTGRPFATLGAPWIHAGDLAAALAGRRIPGVNFAPRYFTPSDGIFKGQTCQGVVISIADPRLLASVRLGLELADVLHRLYPDRFQLDKIIELLGSQSTLDRLKRGDAPADIVSGWAADLDRFRAMREKYLLYH